MEALFYNADDGYLEGIVRGYRGSILTNSAYINLTQCETLEGEASTTHQQLRAAQLSRQKHARQLFNCP